MSAPPDLSDFLIKKVRDSSRFGHHPSGPAQRAGFWGPPRPVLKGVAPSESHSFGASSVFNYFTPTPAWRHHVGSWEIWKVCHLSVLPVSGTGPERWGGTRPEWRRFSSSQNKLFFRIEIELFRHFFFKKLTFFCKKIRKKLDLLTAPLSTG